MVGNSKDLLRKIKTGELVHPLKATDWDRFFQLIKSKLPNGVDIPNPLILGGAGASNYNKNQRLQEHLRIAEVHGLLELALTMLSKIPADNWVTSNGNLNPNELENWQLDELHNKDLEDQWIDGDPKSLTPEHYQRLYSNIEDVYKDFENTFGYIPKQWAK